MAAQFPRRALLGRLFLLTAFGIALGHIEAVAVVCARRYLDWVPLPTDIGPSDLAKVPGWLIVSEQTREVAAIVLLLALAGLAGRILVEKLGVFLFALGLWHIAHYVSLRVMTGWPGSLSTVDCLFLIPRPWFAPVGLPIAVSLGMIALGTGIMYSIERYAATYGPVREPRRRKAAKDEK